MSKITFCILLLSWTPIFAFSQAAQFLGPPDSIQYRDTVDNVATDSFAHNFGRIPILPKELEKPFQYLGDEPVMINKAWTGDPHFICEYPKDSLVPGQHYKFVVCFYTKRHGKMAKSMGFRFSNGEMVVFRFLADIAPPSQH